MDIMVVFGFVAGYIAVTQGVKQACKGYLKTEERRSKGEGICPKR